MKIRLVYHKPKDSWLGRGIVGWTWLLALARLDFKNLKHNFSHVEMWFPDEDDYFGSAWQYGPKTTMNTITGQCFSSTTRGDAEGVRFAPASEVLKHPERWMYQEFEVDEEDVEAQLPVMKNWCGWKYDFAGIFGFFLPWNPEDEEKWYCSELCAHLCYCFDIIDEPHKRISPRRLTKVAGKPLIELKGE